VVRAQDRFCYGIKWLYRSACHHILTAYFDDIAAMAMGHMTGLDICRVLRFCPYYYSGGNLAWSNMRAFPFSSGGAAPSGPATPSAGAAQLQLGANPGAGAQLPSQAGATAQQLFSQSAPQMQQPQQQPQMQQPAQQMQAPELAPVGFRTNPAAQEGAQMQQLLGMGGMGGAGGMMGGAGMM
jgi:hypothetical protein